MATLVLAIGASALSSALGWTAAAAAGSIMASIGVAAIGAGAALIGGLIDSYLFAPGGTHTTQEGPRLNELQIQGSTEGQPIPEVFGLARVAGQMIWTTRFLEVVTTETTEVGGKGGGGGSSVTSTTYTYFGNWAFGICSRASHLYKIWADGKIAYGMASDFEGTSISSNEVEGVSATSGPNGSQGRFRISDDLWEDFTLSVGDIIEGSGFDHANNNRRFEVRAIENDGDNKIIWVDKATVDEDDDEQRTLTLIEATGGNRISKLGTVRFYHGTSGQEPDPLIQSKEGSGNVPAFRGIAYAVFENVALERYGNRIPNLTFEIEHEI